MAKTKTAKVWLLWRDNKGLWRWMHLFVTDDRIDWHHPHAPKGSVRFFVSRRGKNPTWVYAAFGDTREICAEKENRFLVEKVAELREQIVQLEARMLKP